MNKKNVVVLGQFDGVHSGHKVLIEAAVNFAKEQGQRVYVISFSGNYKNEILKKTSHNLLLADDEKIALLKYLGIDEVVLLPFSEDIRNMSPREFVEKMLIEKYRASDIFCGSNYHFGKDAKGTSKELKTIAKGFNVNTHIIPIVKTDGKIISASRIKKYLREGKIEEANKYLVCEYKIKGEVIVGNKIGRTIGFKTANLLPPADKIIPSDGVYKTITIVNNIEYKSMTNIGIRPTVGGHLRIIETNIFDFDQDIYGEKISIIFEKKIREEICFENLDKLKEQLTNDKLKIEELFEKKLRRDDEQ